MDNRLNTPPHDNADQQSRALLLQRMAERDAERKRSFPASQPSIENRPLAQVLGQDMTISDYVDAFKAATGSAPTRKQIYRWADLRDGHQFWSLDRPASSSSDESPSPDHLRASYPAVATWLDVEGEKLARSLLSKVESSGDESSDASESTWRSPSLPDDLPEDPFEGDAWWDVPTLTQRLAEIGIVVPALKLREPSADTPPEWPAPPPPSPDAELPTPVNTCGDNQFIRNSRFPFPPCDGHHCEHPRRQQLTLNDVAALLTERISALPALTRGHLSKRIRSSMAMVEAARPAYNARGMTPQLVDGELSDWLQALFNSPQAMYPPPGPLQRKTTDDVHRVRAGAPATPGTPQ